MGSNPPSRSTSWEALEHFMLPEVEPLSLDAYDEIRDLTNDVLFAPTTPVFDSGGGGGEGSGHLVCKWCRTKRFHRTQALRNHENKCERDKIKERQQQQQRQQQQHTQPPAHQQQRPLRVRPLTMHQQPLHTQPLLPQPTPQHCAHQPWQQLVDPVALWQSQQQQPVAAAVAAAAAYAAASVQSPQPSSVYTPQAHTTQSQAQHPKQHQLMQLHLQNAAPPPHHFSSPYVTPESSPPTQGWELPSVTVNLTASGRLHSLTLLPQRPLGQQAALVVSYAGAVLETLPEVTRPDHYSIWLKPSEIIEAARGRMAFLEVHGDAGPLYRLGFFSPHGATTDRSLSCPGAYNGCTYSSTSVSNVWAHMESCATYLRPRVHQWHRAMRDLLHFVAQLKQGRFALEPARDYVAGDYLPTLYNAIKRSIHELQEMGVEGPADGSNAQEENEEGDELNDEAEEETADRDAPVLSRPGRKGKEKKKNENDDDDDDEENEDEDSDSSEDGRYNQWPRPWQPEFPAALASAAAEKNEDKERRSESEDVTARRLAAGHEEKVEGREEAATTEPDEPYSPYALFERLSLTGSSKASKHQASGKKTGSKGEKKKNKNKKKDDSEKKIKDEKQEKRTEEGGKKRPTASSGDSFFHKPRAASGDIEDKSLKPLSSPEASIEDLKRLLSPLLTPDALPEKLLNARLQSWAAYPVGLLRQRHRPVWTIDERELELGAPIALGRFGQIRKAVWKETTVAVVPLAAVEGESSQQVFAAEMAVVSTLRDPNIVAIHGGFVRPRLSVVTDHTPLGSLYELLHNRDLVAADIPPPLKLRMARQAALGMHFLHSRGLAHDDLRSANLLLDPAGNVKVGRFGFAGLYHHRRGLVGCVPYLAPEVLTAGDVGEDGDEVVVEALADVYAFGVVLWELLARARPYAGLAPATIALRVTRDNLRPDSAAAEADEADSDPSDEPFVAAYRKLLDACWHRDPLVRPTFGEVSASLSVMSHATTGAGLSGSTSTEEDASSLSTVAWLGAAASHGRARPPEGKVAFVFTEIANAPRLWSSVADPAAMHEATLHHNLVLRAALARHAGYELGCFARVRAAGEGEAFHLAFPSVTAALAWCVHVQRQLVDTDWAAFESMTSEDGDTGGGLLGREGLRVRMGAHVGWPTLVSDEPLSGRRGYGGAVVKVAARLRARARGGQVLLSAAAHRDIPFTSFARHPDRSFEPLADESEIYEMKVVGLPTAADTEADADVISSWNVDYADIEAADAPVDGGGSFGLVSRGRWRGLVGADVAVRRLAHQRLDERGLLDLRAEMATLSRVRHPNVVGLLGACLRTPNLCIVTEWAAGGSLESRLHHFAGADDLSWPLRLRILRDVARGLHHLHTAYTPPIVHGRLTPANVLLDADLRAMVADFGFDRTRDAEALLAPAPLTSPLRPPAWTAPELLRGSSLGGDGSVAADVFALGVIMWEVATRRRPYEGRTYMGVVGDTLEGKRPELPPAAAFVGLPEGLGERDYRAMMVRCWHRKARRRPTTDEVVRFFDEASSTPTG